MGVDDDGDDDDDKDDDDTVDADVSVDGTDGIPTEAAVSGNALDLRPDPHHLRLLLSR